VPLYRDLGPTQLLTATKDQTGRNAGNWTLTADPQDLNCKVALAEVYQCTINGPVGTTFQWCRNSRVWNNVVQGWNNTYDPVNPMFLRPGDTLFFFWRATVNLLPVPSAVLWLRYDLDLPENKPYAGPGAQ
jgi:hypothetical protein